MIIAGTERFEEGRWHNETLAGLPYDDVLWGYMVRICEEMRATGFRNMGNDLVLQCLMEMGTFDWTHADTRLYQPSQAI